MERTGGRLISRWVLAALLAVVSVFPLSSVASLPSLARTQDKPKPGEDLEPKEILDKSFAATGLAAAPAVQTVEVSGQFGPPAGHPLGDFRFLYKSPGSYLTEMNFIGHGQ